MLISKSIGPILGKKITYFDRGVPERSCKKMIHFLVSQFHVNLNLNEKKIKQSVLPTFNKMQSKLATLCSLENKQ